VSDWIDYDRGRRGKPMWPPFETASRIYDIANMAFIVSLLIGVAATGALVSMGKIKEQHFDAQLAEMHERSAQLARDAAEARLEAERIKESAAWRDISASQLQTLAQKLHSPRSSVILWYVRGDPESQHLAAQVRSAFKTANWTVRLEARTPLGAAAGIWVLPNATPSAKTSAPVSAVKAAFDEIGLQHQDSGGPAMAELGDTWGPHSPPVKVTIGSKPEPIMR
jgi:hypothetical protein